ncbi:IS5 family transposase [Bradyrhizobium sp. CB1717]|uniref:IS5 family transposase n=1 Tax=Bradyrhizobium sp. CB1717 TaxID=3039154 RepID=UPI0024B25A8A|nr:IS5 family transposase [Bradyrhizobium sp. CB1717]WFU21591.1 IS5 family transposase [Bradyrhizobium sp. CB1717]
MTMAVKRTGQPSFVEALMPKGAGANAALDRLAGLVKWYRFEKLIGHLRDEGSPGRPGYPVLVLFRAVLLQSLYGLSERELEEALGDRLSFKRFVGLSLEDATPDHTVLNRFRNQLVEQGLLEKLFGELDRQLENAGVILKRGTMLDATLIQAVSAPPKQDRPSNDPDARFTKRQGKGGSTFGYKAHMGVDEGSGLIRAVLTTPANVNDTTPADELIRGDEAVVWADAAYDTHARRARLKAEGKKPRIARRPNRHHPELPPRLKRYNLLIARRRAQVETTFATLKRRMRLTCIRYVGLMKASGQVLLASIAFNMRRWAALAA